MVDLFSFLLKGGAPNCPDVIQSDSGEFVCYKQNDLVGCGRLE